MLFEGSCLGNCWGGSKDPGPARAGKFPAIFVSAVRLTQSPDHPTDNLHQKSARQGNADLSLPQTEVDVARQPPQPEFREPGSRRHEDDEKNEYCENPAHPRIVRPEPCSTNSL